MANTKGGALPIYMGAPNVDDWTPGQMSIVKSADFRDPEVSPFQYLFLLLKSLARYLKFLDSNDKAYNQYFEWKSKPLPQVVQLHVYFANGVAFFGKI